MKNVTVKDIREHYTNTHFTQNMRFVISGKLTQARQAHLTNLLEAMTLPKGRGTNSASGRTPKRVGKATLYC